MKIIFFLFTLLLSVVSYSQDKINLYFSDRQYYKQVEYENITITFNRTTQTLSLSDKSGRDIFIFQLKYIGENHTKEWGNTVRYNYEIVNSNMPNDFNRVEIKTWGRIQILDGKVYTKEITFKQMQNNGGLVSSFALYCNKLN